MPLIRDNLDQVADLCRKHGVRGLFLIGSALGPEFDPSRSDLDFLVEFEPRGGDGPGDAYFLLLEEPERLFGRRVDLVERHCVRNPVVRASMERSKVRLYVAA